MVLWYQFVFSIRSQIGYRGVSDSILMHHNFDRWFLIGCKVYGSVFSILSSNFFAPHYERSQPLLGRSWATLVILGYLHGLF
jgi:hypothetical protein